MPPSSNISMNSSDFDCFDVPMMDEERPPVSKKKMLQVDNHNSNNPNRQQQNIMQQPRPMVLADKTNFQSNYRQPSPRPLSNTFHQQHNRYTTNNNKIIMDFNNNNSNNNNQQQQHQKQQQQQQQQQHKPVSYQQNKIYFPPQIHKEEKPPISRNYAGPCNGFHDSDNFVYNPCPSSNNNREHWNSDRRNQGINHERRNQNLQIPHHSQKYFFFISV